MWSRPIADNLGGDSLAKGGSADEILTGDENDNEFIFWHFKPHDVATDSRAKVDALHEKLLALKLGSLQSNRGQPLAEFWCTTCYNSDNLCVWLAFCDLAMTSPPRSFDVWVFGYLRCLRILAVLCTPQLRHITHLGWKCPE